MHLGAPYRPVEPLDVAGLYQRARSFGDSEKLVGLFERSCERFLDQEMASTLQRDAGDLVVSRRRNDDRQRVTLFHQRRHVGEGANVELPADLLRSLDAGIVEADELRAGKVAQDSHMVEAQRARADDTDLRRALAQMMTPRPLSSRKRRK